MDSKFLNMLMNKLVQNKKLALDKQEKITFRDTT